MKNHSGVKSMIIMVLAALVVSGLSSTSMADEFRVKPGDTVEVSDGDSVVVQMPKTKTQVKINGEAPKPAPVYLAPAVDDDFTQAPVSEPDDPTSSVELAMRAILTPSSPALGGSLGFSYKPQNRMRLYMGANVAKGLLDMSGAEKELVAFGFTAGASKLLTRTVEIGAFGSASWSYRDITHQISTSFLGAGPGFRVNKFGVFFQTSLMFGWDKKFATGAWEKGSTLEASLGFKF